MWAAIIAGGIQLVSTVAGELMAGGREAEARELMAQAAREYDIPLPELEQTVAEQLGPSAMEGVTADPQAVAAQRAALQRLQQLSQGGPDAQYDSDFADMLSQVNANESRTRAGIMERAADMGGLSGGQALSAQLASQQGAAQRANQSGLQMAAERQRRAYEALRDGAGLAGNVRSQGFSEDSRRAEARDAIARQNAALRTDATRYNNDMRQQQFGNQRSLAQGRANTRIGQANQANTDAANTRTAWAGYGQAGARGAGAVGEYMTEEERRRKARDATMDGGGP